MTMTTNGADEKRQSPPCLRPGIWNLRLYVAGLTPRSLTAFVNLRRLCEQHLAGEYRIEVVDVRDEPAAAVADQVVALPTVIRRTPEPPRRVIGDLSNVERVLRGLGIEIRNVA